MSCLQVSFFGGASLKENGILVELDTRKALALLAYLLLTARAHHRDALSAFFWPDADQASARGALRRTLSSLRKAVGEAALETSRETVGLSPTADLVCDVLVFRQLLARVEKHHHREGEHCADCVKDLTEAVNLYQSDFLTGFGLRDSLAFDDWQFQESEQFRRELSGILVSLVESLSSRAEYVQALKYCRRWLSLDLLNETAHRKLMQLYAFSGQREAALRQYRECVRILETEIGVPPLDETTKLYEEIKLDRLTPPIPKKPQQSGQENGFSGGDPGRLAQEGQESSSGPIRLPMVGREIELQGLLNLYANIHQDGFFAVLVGEAGIGKTRLAEEFSSRLASRGTRIITSRCYDGEQGLPLMPITALLRNGLATNQNERWWEPVSPFALVEAARLVPEIAELVPAMRAVPSIEGPGAQARFYDGLSQTLFALAATTARSAPKPLAVVDHTESQHTNLPGLIILDDLHWSDFASLDVLNFLLRRLRGQQILVLGTWQDIRTESTNRLQAICATLHRENMAAIYHLKLLNESETGKLIHSAESNLNLLSPEWREKLNQEAEGNPFFLTAYLHAFLRGVLKGELNEPSMPESILEMLHARLALVSPAARQILQTAAVIGRSFDFLTLHEVSGRAEEETVVALEELVGRGFIRELQDGTGSTIRYDFNHEKVRWIVCQEISLARARLLHRRIAESMERFQHGHHLGQVGQITGQIALHYQQAGETEKAAHFYKLAGDFARRIYANHDALVHFETALALGYPERAELSMSIGDIHVLNGDYYAAIHSFQSAAAQSSQPGLAHAEWRIGLVYDRLGEWDQAQAQFLTALEMLPDHEFVARTQLLSDWSFACHHRGDSQSAEKLAGDAFVLASQSGDVQALAQLHNLLGVLARSAGNQQEAQDQLEKSLALANQLGSPALRIAVMNNLAMARQEAGDLVSAFDLVEQALGLCKSQGDRHHEAALRNHLADLYQLDGRSDQALAQLKQAVTIFAEIGEETGQWRPEVWKLTEW